VRLGVGLGLLAGVSLLAGSLSGHLLGLGGRNVPCLLRAHVSFEIWELEFGGEGRTEALHLGRSG
jgi:hypothetical protein